jgi:hypothetical protein
VGNSVKSGIKNYKILEKNLEQMRKAPRKVIQRTVSDMKTRAPTWIAAEVANVYRVKKAELKPGNNSLGTIKVEGKKVDDIKIVYKGRVLTPTHFGMSPKTPKPAYTLKAEIIKGQKTQLGKVKKLTKKQRKNLAKNFTKEGTRTSDHSPIMLMHTGNTKEGGTNYIPFQRKSTNRKDIRAVKTISMPQMVSNEKVAPNISKTLNENLSKRLDHHMKLLQK